MGFYIDPTPILTRWGLQKASDNPPPTTEEEASNFFVFSPFAVPTDLQYFAQALLLIALLRIAKMPNGMKTLERLGLQYLKTVGSIITELESSSSSNWMTALINQKLCAKVMCRMGLISPEDAQSLEASYMHIWTWNLRKEAICDTFAGLGSFAKGIGGVMAPLAKAGKI